MYFASKVWKLLVGIKDGLVLAFMLVLFMGLHAALTARAPVATVRDGALLLKLDGAVVEEPSQPDPFSLAAGDGGARDLRARDLVRAITGAAADDHIKAVVLDLTGFDGAGLVTLEELGAAMDVARAAKKPVLVFGTVLEDAGLLLGAHASEVWVDPLGGAFVPGPGGYHLYYGKLLERLQITAHVYRVGTYKDYVEPYLRNDQSPPSRAARTALYAAIWGEWQANVGKARPQAQVAQVVADPVGWLKAAGGDAAKAAKAAGLIDRIGTRAEFGDHVAQLAGADSADTRPGGFAHTSLATWLAANPPGDAGKAIGVVTVAGEITDGKAGPGSAGGQRIARLIDSAQSRGLAALVVRVDSPGGSVTGSEAIRAAIARQRARGLPVAVSMGNVAASGGYWVSTPGQRIFAMPGTITGSIGIFAVVPSFEKALAHYGVTGDGVRTSAISGQPDVLTGLTPQVEAMLQANIEAGYARFVNLVAAARGKSAAQVDAMAQGRVWAGAAAKDNGLVDQFGGLDAALDWVAGQAHLGKGAWHAEYLAGAPKPLAQLVAALRHQDDEDGDGTPGTGDTDSAAPHDWAGLAAQHQRAGLAGAVAQLDHLLGHAGAQAWCLECVGTGVPAPASRALAGSRPWWLRVAYVLAGGG